MAGEDRIRVVVEGDAKPLQAAAAAAKQSVRDLGKDTERETGRAKRDFAGLRAALAKPFKAKVEADTAKAQAGIKGFQGAWEGLRARMARRIQGRVDVDAGRAQAGIAGVRKELGALDGTKATATANVRVEGQDRLRSLAGDIRSFGGSSAAAAPGVDRLNTSVGQTNQRFQLLRNGMRVLKWPALIAGIGTAVQGLAALAAGAGALTAALAPLSGMLVAYPGFMAAIAQGTSVWKFATGGLKEAIGGLNEKLDEKSEAFKKLSPAAQNFARYLQQIKPHFRDLQRTAQQGLFPGLREGLQAAMRNFPVLERVVGRTARALGGLAAQAGKALGSAEWGRDLERIGNNNVTIMARLGRAAGNVANAVRHIWVAAGPTLKRLAGDVQNVTKRFADWAKAGRESGKLANFFERARLKLHQVSRMAANVAVAIGNIFKAGGPSGQRLLNSLEQLTKRWREWTGSAQGQNHLRRYFDQAEPGVRQMGGLLADLTKMFFRLGANPHLAKLVGQIRSQLLPAVERLVASVTRHTGPAFVNLASKLADLFAALAPHIAKVVAFIANVAAAITSVIRHVPGIGQMTAGVMALGAAFGALKLMGVVGGLRLLIGLLGRFGASRAAVAGVGTALGGLGGKAGKAGGALRGIGLIRFAPAAMGITAVGAALVAISRKSTQGKRQMVAGMRESARAVKQIAPAALASARAQGTASAAQQKLNQMRRAGLQGTKAYRDQVIRVKQADLAAASAQDKTVKTYQRAQGAASRAAAGARRHSSEQARAVRNLKDGNGVFSKFFDLLDGGASKQRKIATETKQLAAAKRAERQAVLHANRVWVDAQRGMRGLTPIAGRAQRTIAQFAKSFKKVPGFKRVVLQTRDRDAVAKVAHFGNRLRTLGRSKTVARIIGNAKNAHDAGRKLEREYKRVTRKRTAKVVGAVKDALDKMGQVRSVKLPKKTQKVGEKGSGGVHGWLRKIFDFKFPGKVQVIKPKDDGVWGFLKKLANYKPPPIVQWIVRKARKMFAEGGVVAGFAEGGEPSLQRAVDRGPSDHRGGKFSRPTYLVGEENRPEFVIATNPRYREANLGYLRMAAQALGVVPGFAGGGVRIPFDTVPRGWQKTSGGFVSPSGQLYRGRSDYSDMVYPVGGGGSGGGSKFLSFNVVAGFARGGVRIPFDTVPRGWRRTRSGFVSPTGQLYRGRSDFSEMVYPVGGSRRRRRGGGGGGGGGGGADGGRDEELFGYEEEDYPDPKERRKERLEALRERLEAYRELTSTLADAGIAIPGPKDARGWGGWMRARRSGDWKTPLGQGLRTGIRALAEATYSGSKETIEYRKAYVEQYLELWGRLAELRGEMGTARRLGRHLQGPQLGVIGGFRQQFGLPYVGSFATGGRVRIPQIPSVPRQVMQSGIAMVHHGETVQPRDQGGAGSGAAAASPQIKVEVVLKDRAGELVELVDARADARADARIEVHARGQSKRTRALRSAPGYSRR